MSTLFREKKFPSKTINGEVKNWCKGERYRTLLCFKRLFCKEKPHVNVYSSKSRKLYLYQVFNPTDKSSLYIISILFQAFNLTDKSSLYIISILFQVMCNIPVICTLLLWYTSCCALTPLGYTYDRQVSILYTGTTGSQQFSRVYSNGIVWIGKWDLFDELVSIYSVSEEQRRILWNWIFTTPLVLL